MNIGNTRAQIAVLRSKCIESIETLQTESLLKHLKALKILEAFLEYPWVSACVVPSVKKQLMNLDGIHPIYWISAAMDVGVDFSNVDRATVGADRVANAVAAIHELPLPAIVLDCGTAITLELIDKQKRFLGGAIMPGRLLSRQALTRGTGQLPFIDLSNDMPQPIGRNTCDAIRSGIDLGVLGAIEKIRSIARDVTAEGPDLTTCAVGGDRHFFTQNLKNVLLGPDNFTLKGLAHIANTL